MPFQATYSDLLALRHDIQTQSNESIAFRYFNRQKIKTFFNDNKIRLQIMDDYLKVLYDTHVCKDAQGKYIKDDIKNDWQYVSSAGEEIFKAAFEKFMNASISINC